MTRYTGIENKTLFSHQYKTLFSHKCRADGRDGLPLNSGLAPGRAAKEEAVSATNSADLPSQVMDGLCLECTHSLCGELLKSVYSRHRPIAAPWGWSPSPDAGRAEAACLAPSGGLRPSRPGSKLRNSEGRAVREHVLSETEAETALALVEGPGSTSVTGRCHGSAFIRSV